MKQLSWALGVSTYNRPKDILACVGSALNQTRSACQIVVVDASDDWANTKREIEELCRKHKFLGGIVFEVAEKRGLTAQRNQIVKLVDADVVFMIDDDSLMYSDCAEQIMKVYESDIDMRLMGVQANAVPAPPGSMVKGAFSGKEQVKSQVSRGPRGLCSNIVRSLEQRAYRRLSLFRAEGNFVPFRGTFPNHQLPSQLSGHDCTVTWHLQGYRMTFRREALQRESFTELIHYGEDVEFSYRVSWHGALVTAMKARLFHNMSPIERPNSYFIAFCRAMNPMLLNVFYSNDLEWAKRQCFRLLYRKMVSGLVKDVGSGDWRLPRLRGTIAGWSRRHDVFSRSSGELVEWYPDVRKIQKSKSI